jgi:hypothetical protein
MPSTWCSWTNAIAANRASVEDLDTGDAGEEGEAARPATFGLWPLSGTWQMSPDSSLAVDTGGTIWIPNVTALTNVNLTLNGLSATPTAQLRSFGGATLTVWEDSPDFSGLTNLDNATLRANAGGAIVATNVTSLVVPFNQSVYFDAGLTGPGGLVDLSRVTNVVVAGNAQLGLRAWNGGKVDLRRAQITGTYLVVTSDGAGSLVDLGGWRAIGASFSTTTLLTAQNGGKIDGRSVESILGGTCRVVSDGSNSEINLSSLSAFATPMGVSELTAKNGGVIILSGNVFLLANVKVMIAGNPWLPSIETPGADVSLYGEPWLSYWVEVRDTRDPANPWELFMRVPLTNAIQVISGPPKSWQSFRVHAFVADPAIVDLKLDETKWNRLGDSKRRDGWWVKEDAYLSGKGTLLLRTKQDVDRYTCGAVNTQGKFEHAFGYYVARCKMPKEPGLWPAFWMMCSGVSIVGQDGRDGTEIDIVEMPWRDGKLTFNLHWDGYV